MGQLPEPPVLCIAVVGCGQIVTHHLAAIRAAAAAGSIRGFRIVALCDPSAKRRATIGALAIAAGSDKGTAIAFADDPPREYDSLDALLVDAPVADAVDVVFIALPHDLHVAVATQALEAGKRVVLEKPLAPTLEGCRKLYAAAKAASGMLIVAEQSPYWQEIVEAKRLLEAGAIGTLVSASAYYFESMRDNVTSGLDESGGLGWRCSLERAGGGIVIDGGLHWLRPLRVLCGDVESVVGVCRRNVEPGLGMEGESVAHALIRFEGTPDKNSYRAQREGSGNLIGTFSANMLHTAPMAHTDAPYFRLTGNSGELVVAGTGLNPDGGGGLRLYDEKTPEGRDLFPKNRQGGFFLGFGGLWEAVVDILRRDDKQAALATVREAACDVAMAVALYRSSDTGQWESCDPGLTG